MSFARSAAVQYNQPATPRIRMLVLPLVFGTCTGRPALLCQIDVSYMQYSYVSERSLARSLGLYSCSADSQHRVPLLLRLLLLCGSTATKTAHTSGPLAQPCAAATRSNSWAGAWTLLLAYRPRVLSCFATFPDRVSRQMYALTGMCDSITTLKVLVLNSVRCPGKVVVLLCMTHVKTNF